MARRVWAAVAVAVLLGACGASADRSSAGDAGGGGGVTAAESVADRSDDGGGITATAPSDGDGTAATATPVALPSFAGRDLVVTGAMTVEVEDVAAAQQRAAAAVQGAGGFVADEQSTYGDDARATVTYRVPTTAYAQAVSELAALGTVVEQTRTTEDVTDAVVDLESRLRTARTSVERLRGFLEEATDLAQVALLEEELLRRETEVETLTGSLRAIEDRVALATLVVSYRTVTPDDAVVVAAVDEDDGLPTFLDGLRTGWTALVRGGQVLGAGLGLVLPFAPVALVAWVLVRLGQRLTRRGRPEAPAAA